MSKILIILEERQLYLFTDNKLDQTFPVAIGKQKTPTPTGNFSIINKIKNPYNPALGSRWIQFTYEMHGIHGTNQPQLIGQAVSQGCVRMYNHDVEYIYPKIEIAHPVIIKKTKMYSSQNFFTYTVQKSDTIYLLAIKFNTTIEDILKINNLGDENLIYPGQKLKIPL